MTHKAEHWRKSVAVNGVAAVVCCIVVIVFAVAEFTQGAWVIVIVMPIIVFGLVRTNPEYRTEEFVLEEGVAVQACEAKILRRHVVVIFIDRIDMATARAIQYARTLSPDDLRAVHFNIDDRRSSVLIERWQQVGLARLPLDVVDCPDRRLGRAALELAAELADGETEVSIFLPRRSYGKAWRRFLHDQTADRIVDIVSQLSHVNATIVPFMVAPGIADKSPWRHSCRRKNGGETPRIIRSPTPSHSFLGTMPIADLEWRRRGRVAGRVKRLRVQPHGGVQSLECVLVDSSGHAITFVFLGRKSIPGVTTGSRLLADAMVGEHHGKLAMINPNYQLLSTTEHADTQ